MLLKKRGIKRKAFAFIAGKLISLAWAIFILLLVIAVLETWRGNPYENGFYYAFIYGCAIWVVMYLLSFEPIYRIFHKMTKFLKFPGKILRGVYKITSFTVLGPADLINKMVLGSGNLLKK